MVHKIAARLEVSSHRNIEELVKAHRDPTRDFSSFEAFDPITVHFDQHEPITLPSGTMVTYYGKLALFLACLNDDTHSVQIKKDGSAKITVRDLADPDVFNTWMNSVWPLEHHAD